MAFISKLTDYIIKNYDLTDDSLTVVFPNKRAALTLRNELSKRIDRNIWLPQILSIQEVMSSWSGLQLLENIDIIYELIKIMDHNVEVSVRKNLFALASQIIKDFDEIDQYAVNAKNLFNYLKSVKEVESWSPNIGEVSQTESSYLIFFNSLYTYYVRLREELLHDNSAYYGLMTRKLFELTDEQLFDTVGSRKIIFAGFNALTLTEENIIVRLVEADKAVLFWDLDKYYYEDEMQEAGLFARQFFSKHENLKPYNIENNFIEAEKIINIIGVPGSSIQANALQLKLNEDIEVNKNIKNEVVVLSDETLLIPVLNSIPKNYKDINVTMGYPYSETYINQFIQQLFTFQNSLGKNGSIYFWSLKRLMETEMIKIIFTNEELVELKEFIDKFLKESTYYLTINDIEQQLGQSRILDFLMIITKKWNSTPDCLSSFKLLLNLINNDIIASDNKFVINQISVTAKIINKIERLINKYDIIVQIEDIEMLYKQSVSEMSIKFKNKDVVNNLESSLQIMGLLETRNLDFDIVHILSVNEGVLPLSKSPNSLIPFDLRLEYKLPIYTNKQAVYAYHFYRLIQNAKVINIYYNTLTDDVGEGEPSRFIRQLINEIPKKSKNIIINQITYKLPSPTNNDVVKIEVKKTPEIIEKIKNKLYSEHFNKEKKCYEKQGLSPTSISCYLNCPLKFYIKYIENIKDDTLKESIQANIIGSIIHSTFENLYKEFGNAIIDKQYYNIIENKFLKISFEKALADNNFANGLPNTGFNYLNKIMIEKLIDNFIDYEKKFLELGNKFSILGLEESLSYTFDIGDIKVNLTGFADRIDRVGNKIRILDYKTGKVDNKDVEIKSTIENINDLTDKSLQLCIYKYLYAKNNRGISIDNIEPGILGLLKVNNPYFPLVVNSTIFNNDNFMETCEDMFIDLFKEILNPEIPFCQTDEEKKCKNCDYLNICKRNPKTW